MVHTLTYIDSLKQYKKYKERIALKRVKQEILLQESIEPTMHSHYVSTWQRSLFFYDYVFFKSYISRLISTYGFNNIQCQSQTFLRDMNIVCVLIHRGLKLDGAIGQGEICNSLKSEIFSKSFLSHIGKNKIKFQKK